MKEKRSVRFAALLVTFFMLLGMMTGGAVFSLYGFKDVPEDQWYYPYIMFMYEKEIVGGFGTTGEFRPRLPIIREHAAKMICLSAGLEHEGKETNFADIDLISPDLKGYIAALVEKGAIGGFPDGTFRPRDEIKRGHVCKIVALALGLEEGALPVNLIDLPQNDETVRDAIVTLASNGIVGGYGSSGEFRPGNEISRAELCKILCISMAVKAVQEMEEERTQGSVTAARAYVDALPYVQIPDTVDGLNARIFFVQQDIDMENVYGNYYWRDVQAVNFMIDVNGLPKDKWPAGAPDPPSDWQQNLAWDLQSPKRLAVFKYYSQPAKLFGVLDLSALTELTTLLVSKNELTGLMVRNCRKLTSLQCTDNLLTRLDLSGLSSLQEVNCGYNPNLSDLDLGGASGLKDLTMRYCKFSTVDLSEQINLVTLYCESNLLTTLDVSPNVSLSDLYPYGNLLTKLVLSQEAPYIAIDVRQNRLANTAAIINGGHIPWDTGNFLFSPQK